MRPRTERAAAVADRAIELLVGCLAVAGVACVAGWIASAAWGLGLVSFATGSMTPHYPTGSIAVSVPVRLDQVRIGDVVTVERGGGLPPITHRVVAVTVDPAGDRAMVRLRGDANRVEDPAPYAVTALRKVVLRLPPAAEALRATGSPVVVAGIGTVIAGSLAWAFWPERIRPRHRRDRDDADRLEPVGRRRA